MVKNWKGIATNATVVVVLWAGSLLLDPRPLNRSSSPHGRTAYCTDIIIGRGIADSGNLVVLRWLSEYWEITEGLSGLSRLFGSPGIAAKVSPDCCRSFHSSPLCDHPRFPVPPPADANFSPEAPPRHHRYLHTPCSQVHVSLLLIFWGGKISQPFSRYICSVLQAGKCDCTVEMDLPPLDFPLGRDGEDISAGMQGSLRLTKKKQGL